MRLFASRQLTGDYGTVTAGEEFECAEDVGNHLLHKGLAFPALPPKVHYETKVVTPEAPEVSPREPFRDLSVSDAKPEEVAAASNPVLSQTDVPESGTADPGGRGKRQGSRSR